MPSKLPCLGSAVKILVLNRTLRHGASGEAIDRQNVMYVQYAVAVIPVAIYFILIGVMRLRTRPAGYNRLARYADARHRIAGMVAVGPMQLFTPPSAIERWHAWVWLFLIGLYVLGLILILLSSKPRLIAYGLDPIQFRSVLMESARKVDENSHWSADVLSMPTSGMQLAVEATGVSRVHQATHVGLLQNLEHWMQLEREFVRLGSQTSCPTSIAGVPLLIVGSTLLLSSIIPLIQDPAGALAQLQNFLGSMSIESGTSRHIR